MKVKCAFADKESFTEHFADAIYCKPFGKITILCDQHFLDVVGMVEQVGISIRDHRAKLEGGEPPPVLSDDLAKMQDRTSIVEFDAHSHQQEHRHQQHDARGGQHHIHEALDQVRDHRHS